MESRRHRGDQCPSIIHHKAHQAENIARCFQQTAIDFVVARNALCSIEMYIIAAQRHGLIQWTHVRWNPGLSDTATAGRYKPVSRAKRPMTGISYRHDTATKCGAGHKSALDALALCPLNLRSITNEYFFYFSLRNEIRKFTPPPTKRDEGCLTLNRELPVFEDP